MGFFEKATTSGPKGGVLTVPSQVVQQSSTKTTSGFNPLRWNPITRQWEVTNPLNLPVLDPPDPANIGDLEFKKKDFRNKKSGEILRYPFEALTDQTDYLQIDIRSYNSVSSSKSLGTGSGSLVSNGQSIRRIVQSNPTSGRGPIDATQDIGENDLRTLSRSGKNKFKSAEGSILLPMPSNIQDGNSVSYADGSLDGITAAAFNIASTGMKAGTSDNIMQGMTEAVKEANNALLKNGSDLRDIVLTDLAAQAANIPLGGSLTRDAVFARQQGEIINQNVELLFNGVTLRSFKFSFKFTPRGPKEAQQVGLIINTFKKNMAAKVGGSIDANFLGTPNVFELTYKRGANSHPFLHSFKQCVLTDMSVNYTGEGTYAVYDDSTPVSMILELGFKELEPIYDADYGSEPGVGY